MTKYCWTPFSLVLGFLFVSSQLCFAASGPTYDVVVYGATASGVMAAASSAKQGLRVVLLEPGDHIGGMVTGGLSATDVGNPEVIGGLPLKFFEKLGHYYKAEQYGQSVSWRFEPHVAEAIMLSMIKETGVTLECHKRLREKHGVAKDGNHLLSITTEDGTVWTGRIFIDASYEGDLMAQAGVSYTWGRESNAKYGESLAGVREKTPDHQFEFPLSAYGPDGKLLPKIQRAPMAAPGSGDHEEQAYNFRLIMTKDPANKIPFPKPLHFDPAQYELLANYIAGFTKYYGHAPGFRDLTSPVEIPGDKVDVNNRGPFSTDDIGMDWKYPKGSYAERGAIWKEHANYTKGFFYFLAHDTSVPVTLRAEVNEWGLAKDEFVDSDHWSSQLYVREARRMLGEYVMTQKDVQTDRSKPDSIGMGSYNIDSHNYERVVTSDGLVQNEGDTEIRVKPYQIPYRIIVPKQQQADNLLVPVCVSASHVAYSSLRLEPQYMILGQAAGVAASIAIKANTDVQNVDIPTLQKDLRDGKAILDLQERLRDD